MRTHPWERRSLSRPAAAAALALLASLALPGSAASGAIQPSPRVVIGELLSQDN